MSTVPTTNVTKTDTEGSASQPIRVLAFIEAYSVTGPAKNLIEFARLSSVEEKQSNRVQITIATFQRGNINEPNMFIRAARAAGLTVEVIPEKRALDLSVLRKMRILLEKHQPDIVQTHNVKSHFFACLLGVPRRYPWIAFHHGYTRTNLKDVLHNQFNRWSLRKARRVVTVCQAFAAELEKVGVAGERILVRHNMVKAFVPAPSERVEALRSKYAIPPHALVGVCIGRLSQEKGHIDLIRALVHLRRFPVAVDYRILVVGDGPERIRLQEEARRSGVSSNIIFAGYDSDTAPYYTLADFAVLPSHSEGSPNALLEAMAAGLPTVCTRVGGVPEIAQDGVSALLVEKGTPAALAQALAHLITDEELRGVFATNARRLSDHYSARNYCESIVSLYQQVISSSEARGIR
ncbi:MAG: glycosyltransferase family 4 protein [Candidatus Korobacteraceae bacterium]|jgi:glycosyltransferase involved in cell wall biosynthesis